MATAFKRELSTESSQAAQAGCFDPFESFINYDQTVTSTPSISPLSTKVSVTPTSSTSNILVPFQPSPQTFQPPSHQYDDYKQQTSFPVGALANTYGVNHMDMSYSSNQRYCGIGMTMPPGDGYFGVNSTDDMLDFGTAPTQSTSGHMDLDFGSPLDINAPNTDFVDPAAIIESETPPRTLPSQIHPGRVYPGMHQQAALAKAQADAQQQQQVTAHQQRKTPSHSRQTSRSGSSARPPTDPHVEESISRLLNQMRHSSVASSNDDDAATPTASGGQSQSARMRKDEEDMDEDERLLASEEGKKLSSKERRQLRNKVSARAFRSRRKEYIGQLEGEIAAKSQEADELRIKNEELTAENTRLADLTRMLLSSSAFQTFLSDLSGTGGPVNVPETSQSQPRISAARSQSGTPRKDVNPNQPIPRHQSSQSQNNLTGMTVIPEEPSFEYTSAESTNTSYTENMDFGLYDTQVYAVTAVPRGPAVDTMDFAMLHGKQSNFAGPLPSIEDDAKDVPAAIDFVPFAVAKMEMPESVETPFEITEDDVSDPAFALFVDRPGSFLATASNVAPEDCIFGEIEPAKGFGRLELIVDGDTNGSDEVSSATLERFERLCSRLDASSARVCAITAHL